MGEPAPPQSNFALHDATIVISQGISYCQLGPWAAKLAKPFLFFILVSKVLV